MRRGRDYLKDGHPGWSAKETCEKSVDFCDEEFWSSQAMPESAEDESEERLEENICPHGVRGLHGIARRVDTAATSC